MATSHTINIIVNKVPGSGGSAKSLAAFHREHTLAMKDLAWAPHTSASKWLNAVLGRAEATPVVPAAGKPPKGKPKKTAKGGAPGSSSGL